MLERLGFEHAAGSGSARIPLGWKQKLAFSVALLHQPSIVFLDEPTGGVDPITRRQFWEMIYEAASGGTTVFVTTHYMDEAEYCDRVSIMVDGGSRRSARRGADAPFGARSVDEVFVRLARPAARGAPRQRRPGMSALPRLRAQGGVPHPPRPAHAAGADLLLPVVTVLLFGFAIRTDVRATSASRSSTRAGPCHPRAAQPVRGHRALPNRSSPRCSSSTEALDALFQRGAVSRRSSSSRASRAPRPRRRSACW
jgi:energy-coupling factor transporter ATP-binding protein EcfA2